MAPSPPPPPPKADILPPNAHLVGLWLQLFASGAYFVYLPQCFWILRKKVRDGMSMWLPAVCLLMFLIVSVDLIVEMVRAWHAFSVSGPTGNVLADPAKFYSNAATPESLVKNSITVALAIISDVIIVWRTFIVWNFKIHVIVLPVALLCADIGMGIWSTWTLSQTKVGDNFILADVSVRVKYFFVVTFCVNALCAGLICWKIWRITSHVASYTSTDRTTNRILEVIIESAALYCAHLFALIVSDAIGSNVFFIFLDCLPPVTALVFSMLIVRTRTGAQQHSTGSTSAQSTHLRFWSTTTRGGTGAGTRTGMGTGTRTGVGTRTVDHPPIGVEIDLERVVHADSTTRDTYDSERSKAGFDA